jgi:hypothetical protein
MEAFELWKELEEQYPSRAARVCNHVAPQSSDVQTFLDHLFDMKHLASTGNDKRGTIGPRALTVAYIGVASGTISHALLRSWSLLGLPEGDFALWQFLFVQHSLALILIVSIYVIWSYRRSVCPERNMSAWRCAFNRS